MENEEISIKVNKNEIRYYLTEAMGECCPKFFKRYGYHKQIEFFSPDGFFILWNFATKQDWWEDFIYRQNSWTTDDGLSWLSSEEIKTFINPEAFAKAIYNYLKESE